MNTLNFCMNATRWILRIQYSRKLNNKIWIWISNSLLRTSHDVKNTFEPQYGYYYFKKNRFTRSKGKHAVFFFKCKRKMIDLYSTVTITPNRRRLLEVKWLLMHTCCRCYYDFLIEYGLRERVCLYEYFGKQKKRS